MKTDTLSNKQTSLRALLSLVTVVALLVAIFVPLIREVGVKGLYLAPLRLISEMGIVALAFVLATPIALFLIFTLVASFDSPPKALFVFLAVFFLAFVHLFASREGGISSLFDLAPWLTLSLMLLSLMTIGEATYRRLHDHYLTASLTLPIALAYWFFTVLVLASV